MPLNDPVIEVIACSLADAVAAQEGGATCLELIREYEVGGLTPTIEVVGEILREVKIPTRVMIRETETFFIKDEKIIESLCESARSFSDLSIDGLVLGFLIEDDGGAGIDHQLLARVLSCAPNLKATFHRAFEVVPDPVRAIAEIKRHPQIDRILTSGGDDPWSQKVERFAQWEDVARPEIGMLVGGGTDAEAIVWLKRSTEVRSFHLGRAVREGQRLEGRVVADQVRELVELILK